MAICFASSGYKTKLECIEVHKRTSMLFIYYLVNIFLVKSLCIVSMVSLGWRHGQIICAADQMRGCPFLGLLSHICESLPSSVLCIWRPLMVVQLCKITAFTMEISRPNLNWLLQVPISYPFVSVASWLRWWYSDFLSPVTISGKYCRVSYRKSWLWNLKYVKSKLSDLCSLAVS